MIPLETKESGGKLLPHSVLRGGNVSRGGIMQQEKEKRHFVRDRWWALVSTVMNFRVP
jgi:hypothetical protein